MNIKEIVIEKFGPLKDIEIKDLVNLNIFYGENEKGKTLLIDAILKLLFNQKKQQKGFLDKIKRIKDIDVIGKLIIKELDENIKIDSQDKKISHIGIESNLFKNLFLVRDSDLDIEQINSKNHSEFVFYFEVIEKLTNTHLKKIDDIIEKIKKNELLTGKFVFSNKGDSNHLKDRIELGMKIQEKIKAFLEEAQEKDYFNIEKKIFEIEHKKIQVTENLNNLEQLLFKEKYDKGITLIKEIAAINNELKDYENFTEENYNRIEQAANEKEKIEEDIKSADNDIVEYTEQIQAHEKELEKISQELLERQKKEDYLKDIKDDLGKYRFNLENIDKITGKVKNYNLFFIIFTGLSLISFIAFVFNFNYVFILIFILFLAVSIILFLIKKNLLKESYDFSKEEKEILSKIERALNKENLNINEADKLIEEYFKGIQDIRDEQIKKQEQIRQIKALKEKKYNEKKDKETKREKLKINIESILEKAKKGSIEEYANKLQEKEEKERKKQNNIEILKSAFGKETLKEIEVELKKYEAYANINIDKNKKYDQVEYEKIKKERDEAKAKYDQLISERKNYIDKLKDFEENINEILNEKNKITIDNLEGYLDKINKFIKEKEFTRNCVIKLIEILDNIKKTNQQKLEILFSEESNVIKYFREITDNNYKKIEYRMQDKNPYLVIIDKEDNELTIDKLSGGTFDQLYFAIRLSIAEKIFNKEKMFFILDDAFIKSDINRLKNQIGMLDKLSVNGWQFLYFTAKKEVLDIAESMKDKENLKIIKCDFLK